MLLDLTWASGLIQPTDKYLEQGSNLCLRAKIAMIYEMNQKDLVKTLAKAVGREDVLASPLDLIAYSYDATGKRSLPDVVVFPDSTAEVSAIMKIAHREQVPVVARGAGTYSLGHYDLSMKVLARKMQNVAQTGADLLVTCCPGCSMQLAYGIREHSLEMESVELVELLDLVYRSA